jgi:hypothetical protein
MMTLFFGGAFTIYRYSQASIPSESVKNQNKELTGSKKSARLTEQLIQRRTIRSVADTGQNTPPLSEDQRAELASNNEDRLKPLLDAHNEPALKRFFEQLTAVEFHRLSRSEFAKIPPVLFSLGFPLISAAFLKILKDAIFLER